MESTVFIIFQNVPLEK